MPNVIIESSDKINVTVDEKIAKMSATIEAMLDDLRSNSNRQNEEKISLSNVRWEILEKVIDWCVHHYEDPAAVDVIGTGVNQVDHIDQWNEEFFQMEPHVLIELTKASSSLKIEGLNIATCKGVAKMMKGRKPEEIRRMFNIRNDFTSAEEKQILKENEFFRIKKN